MQQPQNTDAWITCCDCGERFLFSAGEAAYYKSRLLSTPRRCKACRERRRANINPDPQMVQHGH